MADITLGDYAGYMFTELVKAREQADAYSRFVAERYRQDEILAHFSVPRFRIPKIELTVPVLVSGVTYRETIRFTAEVGEFVEFCLGQLGEVVRQIRLRGRGRLDRHGPVRVSRDTNPAAAARAEEFHHEIARDEAARTASMVQLEWGEVLEIGLKELELLEQWARVDPERVLLQESSVRMVDYVRSKVVVDRTELESLLVNPETNVVKNGSSETSVFTMKAEMIEEGFFIRSVKDESTGEVTRVVEFE